MKKKPCMEVTMDEIPWRYPMCCEYHMKEFFESRTEHCKKIKDEERSTK